MTHAIALQDAYQPEASRLIDASALSFVKIDDPGRLEVGAWMAAIGLHGHLHIHRAPFA